MRSAHEKRTPACISTYTRTALTLFQGKQFCRCWVHNAFVNVDGEKMSKSKGNFLTLKSTLTTALDVRAFRYLVVTSQYRTTLGFSMKSLESAKNTLQRLDKLRVRGCTFYDAQSVCLARGGGDCVCAGSLVEENNGRTPCEIGSAVYLRLSLPWLDPPCYLLTNDATACLV